MYLISWKKKKKKRTNCQDGEKEPYRELKK